MSTASALPTPSPHTTHCVQTSPQSGQERKGELKAREPTGCRHLHKLKPLRSQRSYGLDLKRAGKGRSF